MRYGKSLRKEKEKEEQNKYWLRGKTVDYNSLSFLYIKTGQTILRNKMTMSLVIKSLIYFDCRV